MSDAGCSKDQKKAYAGRHKLPSTQRSCPDASRKAASHSAHGRATQPPAPAHAAVLARAPAHLCSSVKRSPPSANSCTMTTWVSTWKAPYRPMTLGCASLPCSCTSLQGEAGPLTYKHTGNSVAGETKLFRQYASRDWWSCASSFHFLYSGESYVAQSVAILRLCPGCTHR